MFYNTECDVLDEEKGKLARMQIDLQPYEKTIQFEDGIEIDITARAFCDKDAKITDTGYLKTGDKLYKIISLKVWSNYLECFLYVCERD
jgi:hypothetical protein